MKRQLESVLVIISAILMGISGAAGQTTFGTITGTVTDPSAAVVPNAKVVITNEQDGTIRQLATGSTGVYTAPNLAVGEPPIPVLPRSPQRIIIHPALPLYRRCVGWYEMQYRPSGRVLFPEKHCWWTRG